MTNERNCENCVHAKPFGGENDNRCDAWECDYIDRREAIEAYKARRDIDLVRCGECKWWKPVVYSNGEGGMVCVQTPIEPSTDSDDFCSYGERRAK